MIRVSFDALRSGGTVLVLGAHSDDIEIGCGGTILRLVQEFPRTAFHWVVFSADGPREAEARAGAESFLSGAPGREVHVHRFRDGFFPYVGAEIKERFEALKKEVAPDLILTHRGDDAHQDHRLVHELTWNTWRDHAILEYEVPKYDGDLGRPGFYVALEPATAERKVEHLMRCFATQRKRPWFTPDVFLGLMRLRGVEARVPFAEAFQCRKCLL